MIHKAESREEKAFLHSTFFIPFIKPDFFVNNTFLSVLRKGVRGKKNPHEGVRTAVLQNATPSLDSAPINPFP